MRIFKNNHAVTDCSWTSGEEKQFSTMEEEMDSFMNHYIVFNLKN